jgi:hypothetical protein
MPRAHHWQLDPNFQTNPSGRRHGRFVPISDVTLLALLRLLKDADGA